MNAKSKSRVFGAIISLAVLCLLMSCNDQKQSLKPDSSSEIFQNITASNDTDAIRDIEAADKLHKISPEVLEQFKHTGVVRVFIDYNISDNYTAQANAALRKRLVKQERQKTSDSIIKKLGNGKFKLGHQYKYTSSISGNISLEGLKEIIDDPSVSKVEPVPVDKMQMSESTQLTGIDNVRDREFKGRGVTIAVIDSGVNDEHDEIEDDILKNHERCWCREGLWWEEWYDPEWRAACCRDGLELDSGPGSAFDTNNHGTIVAGILTAGSGGAPKSKILALKTMDGQGRAFRDDNIAAFDWIIEQVANDIVAIDLVNFSQGGGLYSGACDDENSTTQKYRDVINELWDLGVPVFVATGNDGETSKILCPACIAKAISVSSVYDAGVGEVTFNDYDCTDPTTQADQICCYSNYNSVTDLFAPGSEINTMGNNYLGGTSFASPIAASCAADLLEADPTLSPLKIQNLFTSTGPLINGIHRLDCEQALYHDVAIAELNKDESALAINYSESTTLTFTVTNKGLPTATNKGFFSMSASAGLAIEFLSSDCAGMSSQLYLPGQNGSDKDGNPITLVDKLLDVYKTYSTDETCHINIRVTATDIGQQWIEYRATFTRNASPQIPINTPHISSNEDQQFWPVYHKPITVGSGVGMAPSLTITSTSDATVHDQITIWWDDYDPDSNADIDVYIDNNNSGHDGAWYYHTLEDEDGPYGRVTITTEFMPQGYQFYVYAVIDDHQHLPVQSNYSGRITVDHPAVGSDLEITAKTWDDDEPGNLINGIPEGLETLGLKFTIKNNSSQLLNGVYSSLETADGRVDITDGSVSYFSLNGYETKVPSDDFDLDILTSSAPGVNFYFTVYYNKGTSNYYQSWLVTKSFPCRGCWFPDFQIVSIQYDDSEYGDGDNVLESGERKVKFRFLVENIGYADATEVEGWVTASTLELITADQDYPDILVGEDEYPESNRWFKLETVPKNVSGLQPSTLEMRYGPSQIAVPLAFNFNVTPVPYMKFSVTEWDFGVVPPGQNVVKNIVVTNPGSATLTVTSIGTSHPDTTIQGVSFPWTIAPGASDDFNIVIDTTGMNQFITRIVTVNSSNAHVNSDHTVTITGTAATPPSGSYSKLWEKLSPEYVPGAYKDFSNVATGDSDNDGNMEIILTTKGFSSSVEVPSTLMIYEKVSDDNFQLVFTSSNLGGAVPYHGLAVGDVDGDSYKDIIVVCDAWYISSDRWPYRIYRFEATGNNTWSGPTTIRSYNEPWFINSVDIGNADSESRNDIIFTLQQSGSTPQASVQMLEWSGAAFNIYTVANNLVDEYGDSDPVDEVYCAVVGDSDGDNNNEVVFYTSAEQLFVYERTGNNTFTRRLDYFNEDLLGDDEEGTIRIADVDNDTLREIVYVNNDDEELVFIESTANNAWNTATPSHYVVNESGAALDIGNYDEDANLEIALRWQSATSPYSYLSVWESISNNSYLAAWNSTPASVVDDVNGLDSVNTNSTPQEEIIAITDSDSKFVVLGYQPARDLQIVSAMIAFSPETPKEGDTVNIMAGVRNLYASAVSSVRVRAYQGDPQAGGFQIGQDYIISSIPGSTVANASFEHRFTLAASYDIYIVVDPNGEITELDESNNKAFRTLAVTDDDVLGPILANVSVSEEGGDGDGFIEDDEQFRISYSATDPKGISATSVLVGGTLYPGQGSYYVILGPMPPGQVQATITAMDADNSPASSDPFDLLFNIVPDAPEVTSTNPFNGESNVFINSEITVNFNTDLANGCTLHIAVLDSSLLPISGIRTYDAIQRRVTFIPAQTLQYFSTYTVIVQGGPAGVTDEKGDAMAADYTFTFTTEPDLEGPTVYIDQPQDSEVLRRTFSIIGTVTDPNFFTFNVYYGLGPAPGSWNLLNSGFTEVINGALGDWDTTGLNGTYTIRVVAQDNFLNSSEDRVTIQLDNQGPLFSGWVFNPADLKEDHVGSYIIRVTVSDNLDLGPNQPQLDYRFSSTSYNGFEPMTDEGGGSWRFEVPDPAWSAFYNQSLIFKIRCSDAVGNLALEEREELINPVYPRISVQPEQLDFGQVMVGDSLEANVWLENIGGGTVEGAAIAVAPFSVVSGSPYSIGSGSVVTITLKFSPTSAVAYADTVDLSGGGGSAITVGGEGVSNDSDGDGLEDSLELSIGTNPNDPDSDDDGLNDGDEYNTCHTNPLAWDTDGDALPDAYEVAHLGSAPALDPLNLLDGAGNFDGDANPNVHEYWNGSDPWTANPVGGAGCCYWADAGLGDRIVSPTDAIELKKVLSGAVGNYSGVVPNNGETHELDMDGYVSPLDLIILQKMIQGAAIGILGSRPNALVTAYAPGATVSVGFTTHVTVSVRNDGSKVTPGIGVIFEIVTGQSTATATLLGGDGSAGAGNRYDISGPITPGGLSRIVLRMDSAGTLTLRARIPACGTPGIGRSSPEIVLDPAAVVHGQ